MEKTYITITHLDDYDASRFLYPGSKLTLKKMPNEYDDEAIAVYSEKGSKYGYVANSSSTVARGTHSAGYIYRDFEQEITCIVRFLLEDVAIAELSDPEDSPYSEYLKQHRDQHFVKASGEEREEVLDYLKENGFTVDEERFTEEEILNSPFPIGVEMSTKKVFLISGAAMAGAAASKDMIFTAEKFMEMFQELIETNPR
ncbi:MAG: hypothetical protein IKE28_12695 [Solobacterium sp.]|nr:hypothetical protein [Solobacterium sp.]